MYANPNVKQQLSPILSDISWKPRNSLDICKKPYIFFDGGLKIHIRKSIQTWIQFTSYPTVCHDASCFRFFNFVPRRRLKPFFFFFFRDYVYHFSALFFLLILIFLLFFFFYGVGWLEKKFSDLRLI